MTLTSVTGSTSITAAGIPATAPTSTSAGGAVDTAATGGGAAGAYMVQGSGTTTGMSLAKKMLIGGVVGAGVGFAATFFTPVVNALTTFIPAAWPLKLVAAGIGAVVGAGGALALHMVSKHKQNLALQAQGEAQAQAAQQASMTSAPTTVTTATTAAGPTLKIGSSGTGTRTLQTNLKAIGLYPYKVSGSFDKNTSLAIRKYEVLKGVVPTGLGSPDIRNAVAQDASLAKQYV